jgi:ligand-binding SRPBCC domain-containing protein
MKEVVRVTTLAVPCEKVWARVVTPEGINYELWPFMKMTLPKAMQGKTIHDVPVGEKLGRSWLLLFGIAPFDYDDITIAELEYGHRFLERSTMFTIEHWEHERMITGRQNGCEVRDRVRFQLRKPLSRLPLFEKGVSNVVRMLFNHRHRRLVKWGQVV